MSLCSLKDKGILTSAFKDKVDCSAHPQADNGQKHPKRYKKKIKTDGSVQLPSHLSHSLPQHFAKNAFFGHFEVLQPGYEPN